MLQNLIAAKILTLVIHLLAFTNQVKRIEGEIRFVKILTVWRFKLVFMSRGLGLKADMANTSK